MTYIGIDPGLDGAVAAIMPRGARTEDLDVWLWDTPTLVLGNGKRDYRLPDMRLILGQFSPNARDVGGVHVAVELTHAMPAQGTTSMWRMGYGFGVWLGLLAGLGLPYTLISPVRWKRALLADLPKGKQSSLMRAQQLFPTADLQLKKHDGRADALLLAYYLRESSRYDNQRKR
jgi:crossover junction endodeoxyribonuclease RuvC